VDESPGSSLLKEEDKHVAIQCDQSRGGSDETKVGGRSGAAHRQFDSEIRKEKSSRCRRATAAVGK